MRLGWKGSNNGRPGTSQFLLFTLSGVAGTSEIAGNARIGGVAGIGGDAGIGKIGAIG